MSNALPIKPVYPVNIGKLSLINRGMHLELIIKYRKEEL